jgi:hypothetical protein
MCPASGRLCGRKGPCRQGRFIRARQQDGEHSRRLRFERQRARILSQLTACDVELEDPEPVNHGTPKFSPAA